ncbi:MAG: hypothetical protein MUO53_14575, partial [Maribacter sp.]|nr:hypothetical protein [Maribacter sp.]
ADPTNEYNTAFAVNGANLEITDNGSTLSVPVSSLGTDDQNLNLAGNALSIEDGNSVDLSGYLDNTDDQNLTGATLSGANVLQIDIEGGASTTVDLSSLDDSGTDDQNLNLAANTLSIEDGNSVNLSGYLDNTDAQTLSTSGAAGDISISGGNTIAINVNDADADPTNERNTAFAVNAGNLQITDSGGTLSVPVSSLGTDSQTLSTNGTPGHIAISGGNFTTINVNDADSVIGNEYNTAFAVVGANLTITDGGGARSVALSSLGTDDQYDDEVPLRTPIDVDDAGKSVAQGYVVENNVQEVINAIAPITSKAARIFYPPSIAVDASTNGTGRTLNLYTQYTAQFATPAVASAGAPSAIPTYTAAELYYYVTYYDPAVFANVSINASGVMTYDVIAQPSTYNSLINVVFVVK